MRVYLIGYMGCGKTTLGPKLACELNIPFYDLDELFEERYRISINDFFRKYGESNFREIEHNLLTDMISRDEFVLATGGGTPCYRKNLDFMNLHGITVFLKMSPEALAKRLLNSARKRPVLSRFMEGDFTSHLSGHLREREVYYLQAHLVIDADGTNPVEIAYMIREKWMHLIGE